MINDDIILLNEIGDPDDMTNLRIVERDVLIPKLIRSEKNKKYK